jgi:Ni/Fe-hydrogenase subunit HybB-like protein
VLKIGDLAFSGELDLMFKANIYTALFWIELGAGVILPTVLFLLPAVRRSPGWLFTGATLVIGGLVLNRFDTSLVAVDHAGASYVPHIFEFAVTISIIAAGVLAYSLVARFLPLFTEHVMDMGMHGPEALARNIPAEAET